MSELKKCPFCGKQPRIVDYFVKGIANHKNFYISCQCGWRTRSRKNPEGAMEDWQSRPLESALQSALTLAQEENKRYKLALEEARSEASDGRDGTVSWQMIYRLCDTALNGGR